MFKLRIEDESGESTVALAEGASILGRGDTAEVKVEEPRASREHLALCSVDGGVLIRDLGSTNGTFVDERPVLQRVIRGGEKFRIGRTHFTLIEETPPPPPPRPVHRKGNPWTTALAVFGPALVLLMIGEFGIGAMRSARDIDMERATSLMREAAKRIELSDFRRAAGIRDAEEGVAALAAFVERHPGSEHAAEAGRLIAMRREQARILSQAEAGLADLKARWKAEDLTFSEYCDSLEMLLRTHGGNSEVARRVRRDLAALKRTDRENASLEIQSVREGMMDLARKGQYGRALAQMTDFTDGHPDLAAAFPDVVRAAERAVLDLGERDYREVLRVAAEVAEGGDVPKAVETLRKAVPRFSGTRFSTFLMLRADFYGARTAETVRRVDEDQLILRRSYHLLAREAEELAAGGMFLAAAQKYAGILDEIRIPAVRADFEARGAELRSISDLITKVQGLIEEKGRKFGSVRLGGRSYILTGCAGGTLYMESRGSGTSRPWAELEPAEVLTVLRRANLPASDSLAVASFCVETNLQDEFRAEILAALGREKQREDAGRLYARKQGMAYPQGGFLAHKGRILTGSDYAEEIHKERIAKLRDRQQKLYERVRAHPVFKRLQKLRDLRRDLDKARQHALALIFDEVKYFYPYRDRMKEYQPVQREVDLRVQAVREIWDSPLKVSTKMETSLKTTLQEADEIVAELKELGVDNTEFVRSLEDLTMYLDRTLTIRDYFHDKVELVLLTYNRRMMEWNVSLNTVALDPERRQVEITNEYRAMMGRRALAIDDRLVRSSRGHSEEMSREGYFGHFSPHPERRTPQQRMALEGYKGSGASENCHMGSGSPEGAHNGWVHSSGHHRNILHKYWTEMGTGQAGKHWTQNFGRTKIQTFSDENEGRK